MRSKVLVTALVGAFLTACGPPRVEYIEVKPDCAVPVQPALPEIPGSALDPLPDDVYYKLERREKEIADWAFKMQAQLEALCGQD